MASTSKKPDQPVGLVTGGGRGIGLATACAWAHRGVAVAVVDRDSEGELAVESVCKEEQVPSAFFTADVRDFDRAEKIVGQVMSRFGRIDYLVANAGLSRDRVIWKMSEKEWDEVVEVNLKGSFNYARAAAPRMREQGFGRIVFVSSINGLRGKFGQCNYAAAKAGLVGLARSLALELGSSKVTVNVVAPGMVNTTMTASLPPAVLERARSEAVLDRTAEPEEVAQVIDFLCRSESRHITGVVLRVDGGQALAAELG